MIEDYPPDLDPAAVLAGRADEQEFWQLWRLHAERSYYRRAIERGQARGVDTARDAEHLAELPEISAVQALEANRCLVELLTGRRWFVMEEAREAGVTWAEIGAAIGTTRQGAQDWYRRRIEEQEQLQQDLPHLPDLHDAARAREVLDDDIDDPAEVAASAHPGQDQRP